VRFEVLVLGLMWVGSYAYDGDCHDMLLLTSHVCSAVNMLIRSRQVCAVFVQLAVPQHLMLCVRAL
jgi:hypothetical protein